MPNVSECVKHFYEKKYLGYSREVWGKKVSRETFDKLTMKDAVNMFFYYKNKSNGKDDEIT